MTRVFRGFIKCFYVTIRGLAFNINLVSLLVSLQSELSGLNHCYSPVTCYSGEAGNIW